MVKTNKELKVRTVSVSAAKGRPMLSWVGKRSLTRITAFPAQKVEVFQPKTAPKSDWDNLLFHGDNKEVLAYLLENGYRGKINLIYIDPPFDSKADYVRKVELRGLKEKAGLAGEGQTLIEQIQYEDMWANDNYLQFMYERLLLLRELLAEEGSIYLHCDWHKVHHLRCLMDEVFGEGNCINEIIWCNTGPTNQENNFPRKHQTLLFYRKGGKHFFNADAVRVRYKKSAKSTGKTTLTGRADDSKLEEIDRQGKVIEDWWIDFVTDVPDIGKAHGEDVGYPTQKTVSLLERIVNASSKPGDLILDCFIGSGTTAVASQKLGRRWIGCDINKGAIQTTAKRLQKTILEQLNEEKKKSSELIKIEKKNEIKPASYSFGIYRVNDYDLTIQRNEAVNLAIEHIGIQRKYSDTFFDGTLGDKLVKIIPFEHPLTLLDLQFIENELKARPNEERDIVVVCLGKETRVDPFVAEINKKRPVNHYKIIELRTDERYGKFFIHNPAKASVDIKNKYGKVSIEIKDFISPTIIERFKSDENLFSVKIKDFRSMIDTVLIDTDYDGKTFNICYSDVPEKKKDLIKGVYELTVPNKKSFVVVVKIIDMLGEEVIIRKDL